MTLIFSLELVLLLFDPKTAQLFSTSLALLKTMTTFTQRAKPLKKQPASMFTVSNTMTHRL